VQDLKQGLLVDDEWCVDSKDGFEWWPGPFSQRIRIYGPKKNGGNKIYRVSATSKILNLGLSDYDSDKVENMMMLFNRFPLLNSYVYDRERNTVSIRSSCYFMENNRAFYLHWMTLSAAFQISLATIDVSGELPNLSGGVMYISNHPKQELRMQFDDLTNTINTLSSQTHEMDDYRISSEIKNTYNYLNEHTDFFTTHSESGLSCEFPFISDEPAALKAVNLGHGSGRAETALLRVTTVNQHPKISDGFLVQLHLPVDLKPHCITELNKFEAERFYKTHVLGAWTLDDQYGPTHSTFIPFVGYKFDKSLLNIVLSYMMRTQNVRELMVFPDRLNIC